MGTRMGHESWNPTARCSRCGAGSRNGSGSCQGRFRDSVEINKRSSVYADLHLAGIGLHLALHSWICKFFFLRFRTSHPFRISREHQFISAICIIAAPPRTLAASLWVPDMDCRGTERLGTHSYLSRRQRCLPPRGGMTSTCDQNSRRGQNGKRAIHMAGIELAGE